MRCLIVTTVLIVVLTAPAGADVDRAMTVDEPAALAIGDWRRSIGPGFAKAKALYQLADHQGNAWSRFQLDTIEREPHLAEPEMAVIEPAGGRFGVQLGAFRQADSADVAWQQLSTAHPDLLGGLGVANMYTEMGIGEAAFNRLVVGAFETKAAAQELCDRLRQRDVDCFIPRP